MKRKIKPLSGDAGKTSLYSGEEISKNSSRITALGDLDELNSLLGVCRAQATDPATKKKILAIQKALFHVGSELATTQNLLNTLSQRIDETFLSEWVTTIDQFKRSSILPTDFVIPGDSIVSAYFDLARAVSRRFERSVVQLFEKNEIQNELLLIWCNRLSYYLYLLARRENKTQKN